MKKFIHNLILFLLCTLICTVFIILFLPNPTIEGNILYANKEKQIRLQSLPSPKVIIIGGSNAGMGINSSIIQDSIGLPVVNMAIHGGLGLYFMMNEVLPFVKEGDKVVVLADYYQFFQDTADGEVELAALLIDANPDARKFVSFSQELKIAKKIFEYGISKIKFPTNFFIEKVLGRNRESWIYMKSSLNEYGDLCIHWNMPKKNFPPLPLDDSALNINEKLLSQLHLFKCKVEENKASFYLLPPSIQETSYKNILPRIERLKKKIVEFQIVNQYEPQTFSFSDSLFFDHPFHLRGKGVELNTRKIIRKIFQDDSTTIILNELP